MLKTLIINTIISSLLTILLFSCNENSCNQIKNEAIKHDIKEQKKKIDSLYLFTNRTDGYWCGDRQDTSIQVWFEKNELAYLFSLQCLYSFPTTYNDGSILMYWIPNMDCTYNMEVDKFQIKDGRNPKKGDVFAKFTIKNPNTILVEYFYPDWVRQYNQKFKYYDYDNQIIINNKTKFVDSLFYVPSR